MNKVYTKLLDNMKISTIIPFVMVVVGTERRLYVTIRDPKTGKSRNFTVRGEKLTAARLVKLISRTIRDEHRKAG